jgi:hypothetical protein
MPKRKKYLVYFRSKYNSTAEREIRFTNVNDMFVPQFRTGREGRESHVS